MSKMWRYKADGTVEPCDDTPDEDITNVKYQKSAMRAGMWIYIHHTEWEGWRRVYDYDENVPKIVKMMDLLDP